LLSGNVRLHTHEGVRALDDAIRFLHRAKPLPPLALSPGLCLAAADHCREQAGGATGHYGNHGSDPRNRISRYGVVSQGWAENIAYGRHTAREIVLALIVDDGVWSRPSKKHFQPNLQCGWSSLWFARQIRQRLQYRFRQWLRGKQISARGKRRTEFLLITDLFVADGALFL
jgi:Cysteine-rich secretory protein family